MTADPAGSPVKWRRIETALRAQTSALPPGQPVPAILATASAHRTTRQTAAKAYRQLAREGLLIRYPGLGYYTPPPPGTAPQPAAPARQP